ncbi:Histidinol dehydrogenase 2 [Moritella viscosa]|nr:Histidinol dehydrogenase 2 [Moritella viscosa]SHO21445.1 Histidinol dehydrogenase 2 [Moritella viscosa]
MVIRIQKQVYDNEILHKEALVRELLLVTKLAELDSQIRIK